MIRLVSLVAENQQNWSLVELQVHLWMSRVYRQKYIALLYELACEDITIVITDEFQVNVQHHS